MTFPSVSSFSYSFAASSTSGFNMSVPLLYDSVNRVLEIRQRSSPIQQNFANKIITISTLMFTAPPSMKQFSMTVQSLRNNHLMSQGLATTNAVANSYLGSISSSDMSINKIADYSILVEVKDIHNKLMMIEIIIP